MVLKERGQGNLDKLVLIWKTGTGHFKRGSSLFWVFLYLELCGSYKLLRAIRLGTNMREGEETSKGRALEASKKSQSLVPLMSYLSK